MPPSMTFASPASLKLQSASNRLGSMTITMPKATRPPVGLIHSTNKHQRWERAQTAFDAYNI
jgi:hypothetical protein